MITETNPVIHQLRHSDMDIMCECGWYNHSPDPNGDVSATAHIMRAVALQPEAADWFDADYRQRYTQ